MVARLIVEDVIKRIWTMTEFEVKT